MIRFPMQTVAREFSYFCILASLVLLITSAVACHSKQANDKAPDTNKAGREDSSGTRSGYKRLSSTLTLSNAGGLRLDG